MMPHFPKPFWREDRQRWMLVLDGRHITLGKDQELAFKRYHELMQERPKQYDSLTVAALLDQFLGWSQQHSKVGTYKIYRERFQKFLDQTGKGSRPAEALSGADLQAWVSLNPAWSPTTIRGRITVIQRAFVWAVKQGLLKYSPVQHVEKPSAGRRENVIDLATYEKMFSLIKGEHFKTLITLAWETGARPQELMRVEARHVNMEAGYWMIPPSEAKGHKRVRIVYMNDKAKELTRRSMEAFPEGPILRTRSGSKWSAYSVGCRFDRLSKKTGHRYALVDFRHSFVERYLKAGVDSLVVGYLLGHSSPEMLGKIYSHLSSDPAFLRSKLL